MTESIWQRCINLIRCFLVAIVVR